MNIFDKAGAGFKKHTNVLFSLVLVSILAVGSTGCASASKTLAHAAEPSPILFAGITGCLNNARQSLSGPDAAKFCLDARKLEVERATKTADASARAEQSSNERRTALTCSMFTGCGNSTIGGTMTGGGGVINGSGDIVFPGSPVSVAPSGTNVVRCSGPACM